MTRHSRPPSAEFKDTGHGYDALGMSMQGIEFGLGMFLPLYKHWFRVQSEGIERIPSSGRCILASNHSGSLPFDGFMTWVDIVLKTHPRRYPRPVGDTFVAQLPWVGRIFTRGGMISGSRGNFRYVLENDGLLLVFPEGTPGIGKPFKDRYQLQRWRVGHVELSIRHRAPIVPTAVIGAEEQMPQLARIPVKLFGAPWLPIPATPFPLPVRYHIYYGEPIHLYEGYAVEDADNPEIVEEAAVKVKAAVQALIDDGLERREGVFT